MVDCEIDEDGDLMIHDESSELWVTVDDRLKFLLFFTYASLETVGEEEGIARANELNRSFILTRFSFGNGKLNADFAMSYCGGINVTQFIKVLRRFSAIFREALMTDNKALADNSRLTSASLSSASLLWLICDLAYRYHFHRIF